MVADWVYKRVGSHPYGAQEMSKAPGDGLVFDFGEPNDDGRSLYVARTGNDGFELWVGYRDQWLFHCWKQDAFRLAWWILWDWWVRATWCGLRRWLWFRALHQVVKRYPGRST